MTNIDNKKVSKNIDKVTKFLNSLLLLSNKFNLYISQRFDNFVLVDKNGKIICTGLDFSEDFYSCFYNDNNVPYYVTSDDKDKAYVALSKYYIDKDKIIEMKRYREFELQQEYKDFENDVELQTYNKILEEE